MDVSGVDPSQATPRSGSAARSRSRLLLLGALALLLATLVAPRASAAPRAAPALQYFSVSPSWSGFILPNGSFRQHDVASLQCSESGAVAPITWEWSFGDGTNATVTVTTVSVVENHTYEAVGAYNVTCRGTDSLGAHGSANMTIRVTAWPFVILDLAIEPQPSVLQGYIATFDVKTYWASGTVNYTWTGLPPGCAPPAPPVAGYLIVCAPTAGGTYNVSVAARDSATNYTARTYATLIVTPAFLGMPEGPGLEVVALVVLLAVVSEVLVRYTRVVPRPTEVRRFRRGWALATVGGAFGLLSLFLPWLYIEWMGSLGGPVALIRPVDILANTPTAGVFAAMESARPTYPNFLWFVLAPQIVGYLIVVAGSLLALLRRMQGGFIMLLGLAVAALAIPAQAGGFWGLDAGWYLGLIAASLAAAGFYVWRPPVGRWPPVTPVPMMTPSREAPREGPPESPPSESSRPEERGSP